MPMLNEIDFFSLVENSILGIFVHRDYQLVYINSAFARMLGYSTPANLLDHERNICNLLHPEEVARICAYYEQRKHGDSPPESYEARWRHRDGSTVWLAMSAQMVEVEGVPHAMATCQDVTARKEAETKADEIEQRYTAQYKGSPLPAYTWLWDGDDFMLEDFNDAALRVTEGKIESHRGVRARAFYPDLPQYLEAMTRCLESQSSLSVEIVYPMRTTGVVQDVICHFAYIPPSRVMVFSEIVTGRKEAESRLQESDRLLRLIANAVPVSLAYFDNEERWRFAVNTSSQWMAHDLGGLIGRKISEVQPPETYTSIKPYIDLALAGKRVEHEEDLLYPDGIIRRSYFIYIPDIAEDGTVNGFTSMVQDVSDKHRAEEKLRENDWFFQVAQQVANLGVWVRDLNTGELHWSEQTYRIFGMDPFEEPVNSDLLIRSIHPEDMEEFTQILQRSGDDAEPILYEHRILRRDGQVRYVRQLGHTVMDAQGRPFRRMGVILDITEQRELEEQLRRSHKLEAIGQLAGGVAHEFNNLLQIILGYNELAQQTEDETRRHDNLIRVQEAAERGAVLVQKLLGFSRAQKIRPGPLDMDVAVRDLETVLRPALGASVRLELDVDPKVGKALADRSSVEQMVMNLAINARDAMPGGGTLHIGVRRTDLDRAFCQEHSWAVPGSYVRISVRDDGHGIAPEVIPKIFDPFFTTKGPQNGSGLGLAMVHGLVQQHLGLLDVTSELGKGSTFDIYLPLASAAQGVEAGATPEEEAGTAPKPTVLLAEDEEGVRQLAETLLKRAGYRVICASDGHEAMRLFNANAQTIDLAVLDLVMPHMGGLDVYRLIRMRKPDLPVLFQTGYEMNSGDADFLEEQGLNVMHKPFAGAAFREAVACLLAGKPIPAGAKGKKA